MGELSTIFHLAYLEREHDALHTVPIPHILHPDVTPSHDHKVLN